MKRNLLILAFFCALFGVKVNAAQTEPLISLKADVSSETRELVFSVTKPGIRLQIDWGDGVLVQTDTIAMTDAWSSTTTITGTPKGTGEIKIYGTDIYSFDCSSTVSGPQVREVNLTKATDLAVLSVNTNSLKTLDLSGNVNLKKLNCYNNKDITSLNLQANTLLERLDAKSMGLTSIDLSKNVNLTYLSVNDNTGLGTLNLENNINLTDLYALNIGLKSIDVSKNVALEYISFNNNSLTSLDATACTKLERLFCMNNELTSIQVPSTLTKSLNLRGNNFTFATLPVVKISGYFYDQQKPVKVAETIAAGESIDLAYLNNITGLASAPQPTTYVWKTANGLVTLKENEDYTAKDGVFTFLKEQAEPVVCAMTTAAFPKFTSSSALTTTPVVVEKAPEPAIILKADVSSETRELTFSAIKEGVTLQIDWGDGVLVQTDPIVLADPYTSPTSVFGTPKGTGEIKIYGKGIYSFDCSSTVTGPQVREIDLTKATDLAELTVNTNSLKSLDLSGNANLKKLNCYNNKDITSLNLQANTLLERVDAKSMGLTSIDLSKNVNLTYLALNDNTGLGSLNLENNINLTDLYALNIGLKSVDVSKNVALEYISFNNNSLTSLDVTACTKLERLFCMNNELTSLQVPSTLSKSLNVRGNNLTFATLPAVKISGYFYDQQKPMVVDATLGKGEQLDLSALTNVTGLAAEPQAATYVWKTADGSVTLAENVDYEVKDGVFSFLKAQSQPIYATITNPAFPKLTLKTTEFSVVEAPLAISLKADVSSETRELTFSAIKEGVTLQIDWGDGVLVQTDPIVLADPYVNPTSVFGTPKGTGEIKIYGTGIYSFDCSSTVTGPQVREIDLTKATDLVELTVNTNSLKTLDLSGNVNLKKLNCYNNKDITSLNLQANTLLERVDAKSMGLTSIDLSKNVNLTYLSVNDNTGLSTLNLENNINLTDLYALNIGLKSVDVSKNVALKYISFNNNSLTSLDATACTKLERLFCMNNELTSLQVPSTLSKGLNVRGNNLTFATLPVVKISGYFYDQQKPVKVAETIAVGESIDLAYLNNITGLASAPQPTTYVWKTANGLVTLKENEDYTAKDGVFTFLKEQAEPVVCAMTTAAFPKFTSSSALTTTPVVVEKAPEPIISFVVNAVGTERELTFSAIKEGVTLQIDWGDGNLVQTEPIAIADIYGTSTTLVGTPVGTGEVKIYGKDLYSFECSSTVSGPQVTSIDVTRALDLGKLTVNTNALTTLDLSKNVNLKQLNCYNNPGLTTLNLEANTLLERLDAKSMSLTTLDLSKNVNLTYLAVSENTKLGALNLENNVKLEDLYAINIGLKSIDLSKNVALEYVSLNNNSIESLDLAQCEKLEFLFCMNNELASISTPAKIARTLNIRNNKLTLATLPAPAVANYFYAPQKPVEIAATIKENESLDLSAQNNIQGLATEPQPTQYVWKLSDGVVLKADVDYTEENGVFKFLKVQELPLTCNMTSKAFPSFSGSNALATTSIVIEAGTGIHEVENGVTVFVENNEVVLNGLAEGDKVNVYALLGQQVVSTIADNSTLRIALSEGMYLVQINKNVYKVCIK